MTASRPNLLRRAHLAPGIRNQTMSRLTLTNPVTSGMNTAPGEVSGGRFDW
jgi:hypothetical protein